ncbi:2-C-methyl-D-erythritol 2,4-cyclodiphosphate synthase [Gudongella sp. SC589]|jgi:2-C-methyl-D-erythritol 2,4-cyclodiphosphate synthase|uniref:2-C-methyl-D-erythritol 2,4-cyclodiphosphate synthase n=1 Tax=Gudongella sp. SC589 TaxID=3385990 RepID=UPI003904B15A
MRVGIGYDVHKLVEGRRLVIGGVQIPHEMGLLGHSDADVLVHSLMDAILGAMSAGDIGKHFPDTDMEYKDISSMILLERVFQVMKEKGYRLVNADNVIAAQRPKLAPFIDQMRENIAEVLQVPVEDIGVKATTTERLGFEGREEGISSYSTCLLEKSIDNR